jgi:hypothetical protein
MEPRFFGELSRVRSHSGPAPATSDLRVEPGESPAESEADRIAETIASGPRSQAPRGSSPLADLSRVRVHTGEKAAESARAVGALAYTVGDQIVFGAGRFAPQSSTGRQLLAHELAHVGQQTGGAVLRRKADPDLDRLREYLSYAFWTLNWAITDKDAINALELLKTLPRYKKAVFVSDRKYFERLRDNLPEERIKELDAVQAEVAAITPPAAATGEVQKNLSTGLFEGDLAVTDKEAIASLETLKKLSGVELAVALDAVDTETLMEELPDARKPELAALLATAGRTRQTAEGTALRSLTFVSDPNAILDNNKDLTDSGSPFGQPEWAEAGGKELSKPISQKKGTRVRANVALDLLPLGTSESPVSLRGESQDGFLSFAFSGAMQGGKGQVLPQELESREPLPDAIFKFPQREIRWLLQWQGLDYEVAKTHHTIYSTLGDPLPGVAPTEKRMDIAVSLAVAVGPTLPPLQLVTRLMNRFKRYNLYRPRLPNPWDLNDTSWYGAQCIDIAEFIKGVLKVLGSPGQLDAVVIWAHPDQPGAALEADAAIPGSGTNGIPPQRMGGVTVAAALLDGGGLWNSFEAAIRFTDGSAVRYFPGGVETRAGYGTPAEVLDNAFDSLVWIEVQPFPKCRIHKLARSYRNGRLREGQTVDCQTVNPAPPRP